MKKQKKERSGRNLYKKPLLISAVTLAGAVIVIISAVAALRARDALQIEQSVYTYVNGMKISLGENVRLTRKDGTTYMESASGKQSIQSFPLITEEGSIILQKSCSWNRTSDDRYYRVDYFTTVSKEDGAVVMHRRGREVREPSGFLYDNGDTYLFLERATIKLEEQEISIEPMTLVQVGYLSHIQIFGPDVEPFFEHLDQNNVVAEFESGKKVDLATDRYFVKNGSWRLLFLPLEELQEMTTGETGDEEE